MQWSLFLLILMGQCSFFTCRHYEYHFIGERKAWEEAKKYCRENYTDLAIVYDMTDMKRLRASTENPGEAWIGLYSNPGEEKWHWSLPGVEFSDMQTNCDDTSNGSTSEEDKEKNCGTVQTCRWKNYCCNNNYKFICYNENTESNKMFHLIQYEMNWTKAQNYCRENHTDLVSGCNQLQNKELKNEITLGENLWIGLFRDNWRWSDGSNFSFRNWDQEFFKNSDKKCAMTMLNRKWGYDDCNKPKPFFCYDDKLILIKDSKNWMEALHYCRSNYRDLVSITNPDQQRRVQETAKQANTSFVWLGLRYTCTLDLWFWVSDELVCYDSWDTEKINDGCDMAGAMGSNRPHKWFKKHENEEFNFICAVN